MLVFPGRTDKNVYNFPKSIQREVVSSTFYHADKTSLTFQLFQ